MMLDMNKQDELFELLRKHDVFRFSYTTEGQTVEFFPKAPEDFSFDEIGSKKVDDDMYENKKREDMLANMRKEF